jgi:predicted lysophospholipase L1 biosynthesis ABC-type transport system permease subunit
MVLQRLGSHALAIAQARIALPALETATSNLKRSPSVSLAAYLALSFMLLALAIALPLSRVPFERQNR